MRMIFFMLLALTIQAMNQTHYRDWIPLPDGRKLSYDVDSATGMVVAHVTKSDEEVVYYHNSKLRIQAGKTNSAKGTYAPVAKQPQTVVLETITNSWGEYLKWIDTTCRNAPDRKTWNDGKLRARVKRQDRWQWIQIAPPTFNAWISYLERKQQRRTDK